MKLYSFNLLGPREVDAITGDKIYPPIYRTVQNKQPIPEGTVQKRNSISAETILTGTSEKEVQLISYVYLKAGPDTTAVAAISDRSATTNLYKWTGTAWDKLYGNYGVVDSSSGPPDTTTEITDDSMSWEVDKWVGRTLRVNDSPAYPTTDIYYSTITSNTATTLTVDPAFGFVVDSSDTFSISLDNDTEDGLYYVCNALDFSGEPTGGDAVTTDLVVVKYNSSPSATGTPPYGNPCCYSISTNEADDTYHVTMFDGSRIVLGNGVVWTGNWKNARCAEYHQGKLWVGGLSEVDFGISAQSSTLTCEEVGDTTTTTVTTVEANTKISAGTVIKIDNEEMAVTAIGGTNDKTLNVTRGANNTTAVSHSVDQTIYYYTANAERPYRIRWSKTFDWKTDYDGNGAGSFEHPGSSYMDVPTVGTHTVVGMRSFRGRLYVLTTSDLFVVTGTTSAQYGLTQLFSTPSAIGQTMWASDRYLFWTDANGMHQFNGSQERNLTEKEKPVSFKALNVNKYDISGAGALGRLPTGFINEKLKIYGVHFPYTANTPGKVTWLYNYERESITTYKYTYPTNVEDITYVSDYHDNGSIWVGTSNAASNDAAAYGGKYSFQPVAVDPQDWGANPVSVVLETGDLNLATLNGLSYEDAVVIHRIDLYVIPDPDVTVTYKMDMVVDNVDAAGNTEPQQTVAVAGASDTQPSLAMMPLPALKTGSFFKFTFTEDTANARAELRKVDIFYDIRAIRGATK